MKGLFQRIAATLAGAAIVVGLSTAPARPQFVAGNAVTTQIVTSTAPTGQSSVLALDGNFSNCSVFASESAAGAANITVYGNGQQGQYGPGSPGLVNQNFGTAGVIAVTPVLTVTSGNVANLPVGLYFTWAGNTGTLTAWATCSAAIARAAGGTGPTPTPLPTLSPFPGVTVTTAPCGTVPSTNGIQIVVPYCQVGLFATTGNVTAATTTGTGVYTQLGGNITLNVGNSGNANGWLVTIILDAAIPYVGIASANVYDCATSTSPFTVRDASQFLPAQVCQGAPPAGAFMGDSPFGSQSAAGLAQYGLSNVAIAHLEIANNATFTAACWVLGSSSSTSINVTGYCSANAVPNGN